MGGFNLSTECIRDETCAERKSQRGLWLGVNAFAACDLDRPIAFDHLICDGINADGGYALAFRVSVDFPESGLLQSFHRYQRLVHTGSRSCLRLTHVVASMSPRLDSRWGGLFPFPGGG